ncbi:hypothetical protein LLH06_13450 [Mucilaginibacter daejeonensis]|uniref:hypothetical protein n=1 Tax=Mucilaginibacter daejeonensis TaxID=398049 RepID=UPI001D17C439|nr:hypothetical protein [Mucilaginibacter daejeonensis]UEG51968.1 hypothetical protein LLH06_13450 [Mucilaginibacter daejeonensis]
MKILIRYIVVVALVFAGYEVFSQPPASFMRKNMVRNKVESARDNYIDKQLDLNSDQKAKFWPLYYQYHKEITEVRKAKRQNLTFNKSKDQLDKDLQYDQQLVDVKKRYTQEFARIMPPEKVNKIFQSEREFVDELLRQYGERGTPEQ